MNGKNTQSLTIARVLPILLALTAGVGVFPTSAPAKSLYVIADKRSATADNMLPVQAYDIGAQGDLSLQVQHDIPRRGAGAVDIAIDSDSGYAFITYGSTDTIHVLDAVTMTDAGTVSAPDAFDLAAIAYDHKKKLLYTADLGEDQLYVYKWDPVAKTLTHAKGSPFTLGGDARPHGFALDETNDLLYVASATTTVHAYSTSEWDLVKSISLSRVATSVAVDVKNGFMYTGGGHMGSLYLAQYHLVTGIEREVQVELDAGVMGLAVDADTGLVYASTGKDGAPGGDNLLVYDSGLRRIDSVFNIGNPMGLAIPAKQLGYNPLNLQKTIVASDGSTPGTEVPPVGPGGMITYAIHFENNSGLTATNVSLIDALPEGVIFVKADNVTGNGRYDSKNRTYKWSYASVPPGASENLELTVEVAKGVEMGKTLVNSVTMESNELPRTTARASIIATNNPLHLTKSISGGAGDQVAGVDINEPVTYTICFDNNDNDFSVTDVTIVDVLPDEVTFVAAGEGKAHGSYDAATHSYAWSYPFLLPGSSMCLGLIVRVNPDVAPGTVITNSAIIDSSETTPTTASVDAVMYLKPLVVGQSIVGAGDGQPKWVSAGEKITYAISFQNENDAPVTKVTIVDTLPKETSFVRARSDDPAAVGRYDAKSHTYTWSYSSLPPSSSPTLLDIVVQVNKGVAPGTTITNSVTIDSDQTPPATASAQAVTFYSVPSLSKYVVGSVIGEVEYVDTNDTVVYAVHFNNDNTSALTNVAIVDTLPQELNFVSADGDGSFGRYDAKAHAFTWTFDTLAPKSVTHLELKARVKKGVARQATIINLATVTSSEIAPATANVDVVVGGSPVRAQSLRMVPESINRSGPTHEVQAVLILPAGIGKDAIKDTLPTLYPGRVRAKRQAVYGTGTTAKVIAFFDKAELAAAISANGRVQVKVVGKLKTGPSFFAEAPFVINR